MKRTLQRAGLIAFGLFLAALLGEIGLRVYGAVVPDPPHSAYVRDQHAVYRLRPDPPEMARAAPDDHINALGFRDREHPIRKPSGNYRILGIGDSFVYGAVSVRENFLRVAESRLAPVLAEDSLTVEMVLMGIGGYSPEHEVGLLKSLGRSLEPDRVVLNFFIGNDVSGIPVRGTVWHGQLYCTGSVVWWRDLLRRSQFFLMAERVFLTRIKLAWQLARFERKARSAERAAARGAQRPDSSARDAGAAPVAEASGAAASRGAPALSPMYLRIQAQRLPIFETHPPGWVEPLWRKAEGYVIEFDRVCREAHVPWTLVVIPDEVQVDPEVRAALLAALGRRADEYDFDGPQKRLAGLASRFGISTLDLLAAMRAEHRPDARLYKPNDTHWNERGNRLAGEILAGWIAEVIRATRDAPIR